MKKYLIAFVVAAMAVVHAQAADGVPTNYLNEYSMKLEFGTAKDGKIPGKIHLDCRMRKEVLSSAPLKRKSNNLFYQEFHESTYSRKTAISSRMDLWRHVHLDWSPFFGHRGIPTPAGTENE
jgi:hypothetical protein